MNTPYLCASLAFALLIVALIWWGLHLIFLPPIYQLARPEILYEGYVLLAAALLLLVFYRRLVKRFSWLMEELHRAVSALLVMTALSIDGLMHAFSIPHMEGWWLPLLGSGALASAISGWVYRLRRR